MKIFKKLAAFLTAAVIAVTGFAVTASADSIFDMATSISSGVKQSVTLPQSYNVYYKFTASKSGTLKVHLTGSFEGNSYIRVYNSDGELIATTDTSATKGSIRDAGYYNTYFDWNDMIEKFDVTASYQVQKGEYCIRVSRENYNDGDGKLTVTATYPTSSSSKGKISYISLTLSKGSTIQLGAVVSPSGSDVTWKSSKSSVATVSSSGKVTAKAKGSTIITAKCGSSSKKIKIVVS